MCLEDISSKHYLAELCDACLAVNKQRADKEHYEENKEKMNAQANAYYLAHREEILSKMKDKRRFVRYQQNLVRFTDGKYRISEQKL